MPSSMFEGAVSDPVSFLSPQQSQEQQLSMHHEPSSSVLYSDEERSPSRSIDRESKCRSGDPCIHERLPIMGRGHS